MIDSNSYQEARHSRSRRPRTSHRCVGGRSTPSSPCPRAAWGCPSDTHAHNLLFKNMVCERICVRPLPVELLFRKGHFTSLRHEYNYNFVKYFRSASQVSTASVGLPQTRTVAASSSTNSSSSTTACAYRCSGVAAAAPLVSASLCVTHSSSPARIPASCAGRSATRPARFARSEHSWHERVGTMAPATRATLGCPPLPQSPGRAGPGRAPAPQTRGRP